MSLGIFYTKQQQNNTKSTSNSLKIYYNVIFETWSSGEVPISVSNNVCEGSLTAGTAVGSRLINLDLMRD